MTATPSTGSGPATAFPPPVSPRIRRRFASPRAVLALILREMSTTYGRSPGGYLWAVLEPVAALAILSVLFSIAFRNPALGTNFPLFYATGVVPFTVFMGTSGKIAQTLNFSRQLLAYPTVTYIDAIMARFALTVLTDLMVCGIVFIGILTIYDTQAIPNVPVMGMSILMVQFLGLGVGTLNCYAVTRFPVWQRIWGILMRPMFILCCVLFVFDQIPEPYRGWLWFNPLVHAIGWMRHGVYTTYDALYVSIPYVLGFSAICFVAGLTLLHRNYRFLLQN
jgi:capsular polysaccharide transport system permease protein